MIVCDYLECLNVSISFIKLLYRELIYNSLLRRKLHTNLSLISKHDYQQCVKSAWKSFFDSTFSTEARRWVWKKFLTASIYFMAHHHVRDMHLVYFYYYFGTYSLSIKSGSLNKHKDALELTKKPFHIWNFVEKITTIFVMITLTTLLLCIKDLHVSWTQSHKQNKKVRDILSLAAAATWEFGNWKSFLTFFFAVL